GGDEAGGVVADLGPPHDPVQAELVQGPASGGAGGALRDPPTPGPRRGPVTDLTDAGATVERGEAGGSEQLARGGVEDTERRGRPVGPGLGRVSGHEPLSVLPRVRNGHHGPALDQRI